MNFLGLLIRIKKIFRNRPIYLLVILVFFIWISVIFFIKPPVNDKNLCYRPNIKNSTLSQRISLGDKTLIGAKMLIPTNIDQQKKQDMQLSINKKVVGTQAFKQGDCNTAKNLFAEARHIFPNDPENLIYLNNSQVGKNPLKIAVSVPINNKPSIAQEILRGVAYAQGKFNQTGINNRKILVEIINDDNDSEVVKNVAEELVKDGNILAVIGHNKSQASLTAAEVYKDKLVMVSPTSTSDSLSNYNGFIFRSVLTNRDMAQTLAEYAVKTAHKNKIAVCYSLNDSSSKWLTGAFKNSVKEQGGEIVDINCNLSDVNLNADETVNQAINLGANGLFLDTELDTLTTAINLVNTNQGKLALFGDPTLYTEEILQGQIDGLVLVSPWHPDVNQSFSQNMQSFWGGLVNWRTATAYDATQAIITGLQIKQTRQELQQVLKSKDFKAEGENGEVRFDYNSGDRMGTPILIKVTNGKFENIPEKLSE